jgi:ABC-type Zn uptake system ZnuABC Zn-binding protein ZnuA
LRVVATTGIIGDVVSRVGGEAIELITLMRPGEDPHSYQPAAADLTAVARADVVFVNGWSLEEGLLDDLATIGEGVPVVPISAGIAPLAYGSRADPHTWQSVPNVIRWAENAAAALSALDPTNADRYAANAATYRTELEEAQAYAVAQLATIPADKRVLVTNHDAFAYFADAYGFEVLGTIIPGASTLAEPTAGDLSALIETMRAAGVCAVFTETTVGDRPAQTVAAELDGCQRVQMVKLYSGALGEAGSGADTYTGMFRANVDAIVAALR